MSTKINVLHTDVTSKLTVISHIIFGSIPSYTLIIIKVPSASENLRIRSSKILQQKPSNNVQTGL